LLQLRDRFGTNGVPVAGLRVVAGGVRRTADMPARSLSEGFSRTAQPLVDLQPQFLDHRLGDGIDRFNCCQDRPTGFPQSEEQAAFDRVQRQLAFKMIGCTRVTARPQPLDQTPRLLSWIPCHWLEPIRAATDRVDLDQSVADGWIDFASAYSLMLLAS
jgi:hypothetical protein